jgi:hypothetical protein
MEKPEKLKPVTAEGRDGRVVVKLADEHGKEFAIDLSIFDVSMLVSTLYAAREKALKQPPGNKPKVMLPVDKLEFGKAETSKGLVQVLRVYVTDKLFQDFAVSAESELGKDIDRLGLALATTGAPQSPGSRGRH